MKIAVAASLCLVLAAPCVSADVVLDWNNIALNTIRSTSTNPPRASRVLAMVHCAVFDAVNAKQLRYQPYNMVGHPQHGYSEKAAAAAAAHRVLVNLYPGNQAAFDAALAQSLQGIPAGPRNKGKAWGQACANTIIALRANDNANITIPYAPPTGPGYWLPTPPANAPALLPNWPIVTCWTMTGGDQFRQDGPPALTSAAYTAAFNEVKDLGAVNSTLRTPEQTQIALFWADGAGTATPPGHWNVIAQDLAEDEDNSLLENARLFAMLNCGMADAAICSWDNKYALHHWRPITGIRNADSDGNAATAPDATWTPLIVTPPFPSYTSGHSTFSGAAAVILADFFGADAISFTTTSDGLPGVTRSFTSLSQAANEAADSRLYGGIHWQYDNLDGLVAGQALAGHLVDRFFDLLGDLNHDDQVNFIDLILLLDAWGSCGGGDCPADLNNDGVVNVIDLILLARNMH